MEGSPENVYRQGTCHYCNKHVPFSPTNKRCSRCGKDACYHHRVVYCKECDKNYIWITDEELVDLINGLMWGLDIDRLSPNAMDLDKRLRFLAENRGIKI